MSEYEVTDEESDRQDDVNDTIYGMLCDIAGVDDERFSDVEVTGIIRDAAEEVLVHRLGLMTEYEFYPFIGGGLETTQVHPTHDELEERARKEYIRLYGPRAQQPGWVDIREKNVTLGNVNGPLARFKIVIGKQGFRLRHIEIGRGTGVCR